MKHDVFISYKSEEYNDASLLKSILETNGISCWMAPSNIPGDSSYAMEIPKAIKQSGVVVVLLSESSQQSQWVTKEVDTALNAGKKVLPFQIENCELTEAFNFYLTDVQRYDAFRDKEKAIQDLIRDIKASLANKTSFANKIFFKTYFSSEEGSLFIYSPDCYTIDDKITTTITEEIWDDFSSKCKRLISAVFPGVLNEHISIVLNSKLGEYRCAPNDGLNYYDSLYRINFRIAFIRNTYSTKYDSVHFEIGDTFKITLFKQGNFANKLAPEDAELSYFDIDETPLIAAAKNMLEFTTGGKDIVVSKNFRKKMYPDGSGGYYIDYIQK